MGEYAKRKSDNKVVKIGTCESMYYLRYEDRKKVIQESSSLNPAKELNLYWRLPVPEEDKVPIGEYEKSRISSQLYKKRENGTGYDSFEDERTLEDPGFFQMSHKESGLLINVPCYHGMKLPDLGGAKVFWNGKGHNFELVGVKNTETGLRPLVCCRHCGKMWSYDFEDIMDYVSNKELKKRLENYRDNFKDI